MLFRSGGSATEPWPVTIADQNNHCLRTPTARTLFDRRVTAGLERADEPPLQLLLDDLASRPERYRNAIFVNLHGSGLPMPPLRNYSDAAKTQSIPWLRAVTHPEDLRTKRNQAGVTDPLKFRMYAYTHRTSEIGRAHV